MPTLSRIGGRVFAIAAVLVATDSCPGTFLADI
jgi:hypothetical protein